MGDNLDDLLDSALDDFEEIDQKSHFPPPRANNTTTSNAQQPSTATSNSNVNNSNSNRTNSNQPGGDNKEYGAPMEDTEKLVEEFQRDMNKVLEELQGPDFMKALDEMAKKMQEEDKNTGANIPQQNTPSNNNNNNASSSGPKLTEEEEIQKKLQETLKMLTENVKKMEENASQTPSDPKGQDQMLEDLLKGMENDDQLSGMVENVMKQLISKDILYEPMKEMQAKYPKWLADNKSKLNAEDYQRYVQQYEYVNKIVNSYNTNPNYFDEVVNLMQAMQESGQPPEELMQQMSPEGGEIPKLFGNDAAPGKDGGCPMQ